MSSERLRVFFYVQHLLGIGHLMRAGRIARALQKQGFDVTLVTGGSPVDGFDTTGFDHIALPSMAVRGGDFSVIVDAHDKPIDSDFKAQRCKILIRTYYDLRPDVVILEAYPFGRRQLQFELTPLIEAIETTSPKPLLVSSVRDILQKRNKPGRAEETVNLVKRHFDAVLVHGDPAFVRLEESFPKAVEIADQIVYTGVVSGVAGQTHADQIDIVVSAGGGAVGVKLLEASVFAASVLPERWTWCIVTGPNLSDHEFSRIVRSAPAHVDIKRFVVDFQSLLASSRLSISQAGYNTVSDILQAGCRAILVPYSMHGETEQSDRALRLEQQGVACVLPEALVSGERMTSAIRTIMAQPSPEPAQRINTDGAQGSARVLKQLLASSGSAPL